MQIILLEIQGKNSLDYICTWFYKAAKYIRYSGSKCSFVTTNSICQGDHVGLFWPHMLKLDIEIDFAHQAFKWTNNARRNAGVTCFIIGLRPVSKDDKYLFGQGVSRKVENISPYITASDNTIVHKRSRPLSKIPTMSYGNQPIEGGFLTLDNTEKKDILEACPQIGKFIRPLIGGNEFLKDLKRWCLWIEDDDLEDALSCDLIRKRILNVRKFRESGGQVASSLVNRCHQYRYRHEAKDSFVLVPCTSSEGRAYLPVGYCNKEYLTLHSAQIIYDPPPYIFACLSSRMHLIWIHAVVGRLENRIRYSSALGYNTFPFPEITDSQKHLLENAAFNVLDIREKYSEKTISQLYDQDHMPLDLLEAHSRIDAEVEKCYRNKPFSHDEDRLEHLFKLYLKMVN